MRCIYCNNNKLYKLNTGHLKCSECKKKFNPLKIDRDIEIIECFALNLTANQSSKKLHVNYVTIKRKYELFRQLIATYLENAYRDKYVVEYDEYIYLPQSKKKVKETIFNAQNFLTFSYDRKVYNLLMPNLNRYKTQFMDDRAEEVYFKEFSKFMMFNKISKTQKRENIITKFWNYFEESILKYRGINDENFFYYLKEIEFKFNFSQEEQKKILLALIY